MSQVRLKYCRAQSCLTKEESCPCSATKQVKNFPCNHMANAFRVLISGQWLSFCSRLVWSVTCLFSGKKKKKSHALVSFLSGEKGIFSYSSKGFNQLPLLSAGGKSLPVSAAGSAGPRANPPFKPKHTEPSWNEAEGGVCVCLQGCLGLLPG